MTLFADFVLVAGIVMTVIILFLLIRSQRKELPQRILIAVFVYILLIIIHFYCDLHEMDIGIVLTFIPMNHIELVIGPLMLFYVRCLFVPQTNFFRRVAKHFIPAVVYTVFIALPILISLLQDDFIFGYLEIIYNNHLYLLCSLSIFLIVYIVWSLSSLNHYTNTLKLNYSNLQERDLSWVKYLLWGFLAVVTFDFSTNVFELIFGELDWDTGYITMVFLIGVIFYLGYYGTSQSRILIPAFLLDSEVPTEKIEEAIISKQPSHHLAKAEENEIESLKNKLNEVLLKDKPYLNEELTLGALAEMIPTTDKKLSALLNHYMDISFYDLINQYRVEEVKAKMADNEFENYTLLALAFDSGFKSKTSFNRIFKKVTGFSPSAYKKQI